MKQEESIDSLAAVLAIQVCDAGLSKVEKRAVFRHVLLAGIAKIRQKTEVHIVIAVGQKADLQGFDQLGYALWSGKHGGNHDERAQLRWDSLGKIHPRQQVWRRQLGHQPVEHGNHKLGSDEKRKNSAKREGCTSHSIGVGFDGKDPGDQRRWLQGSRLNTAAIECRRTLLRT